MFRSPFALILLAGATGAATLPLQPGTYVLAGTPCADPPFAATFDYDGQRFAYPHATKCQSTIVARRGSTYRVREACSALGDGSAAPSSTTLTTYVMLARDRLSVRQAGGTASVYRRCGPIAPRPS